MQRRTPLARGVCRLARSGLRSVSQKRQAQRGELERFRSEVLKAAGHRCERCGSSSDLHAHHLVSRARGRNQPWLHDAARNGACLCAVCHSAVHEARADDWRDWVLRRPRV